MTLRTHMALQVIISALMFAALLRGDFPPKYIPIAVGLTFLGKDALSAMAQHFNTDGSPQEVPGGKAGNL